MTDWLLIGAAFVLCVAFAWLVTWMLPAKVYDEIWCRGQRYRLMDPAIVQLCAMADRIMGHPWLISANEKAWLRAVRAYLPTMPSEEVAKLKSHYIAPVEEKAP